jgi:hypothetical protein
MGILRLMRLRGLVILACFISAVSAGAQERAGGPPPPVAHQNLQLLPKDIPQADLLRIMQGFTQGLGVQCGYCHAPAPAPEGGRGGGGGRGRGAGPQFDFGSDQIAAKKKAREMMTMVRDLNTRIPAAVGKTAETAASVQCATCHGGVAIPKPLGDVLDQTAAEKGVPAAVAQYRELRKQFFGGRAYDFSEGSLINLAQRTPAKAPADAMAWLQLNLEYFPYSARTHVAMSQVQQRGNDKDAAIKSAEKALELDPQNAAARRQLDQLKEAK